jgi:hypothetical protein
MTEFFYMHKSTIHSKPRLCVCGKRCEVYKDKGTYNNISILLLALKLL